APMALAAQPLLTRQRSRRMLKQWSDDQTIQYAAAVAGLVCASFPGVLNSPTHAQVMQFIHDHGM
ncbi:MAG: hypothetical protein R6V73_00180, partial [Anaerolineales bacterium]